jgi:hypothetical protein
MTPGRSLESLVLSKDPGLVVAEVGPVCAVVWRSTVTRARFEAQRRGLDHVVRSNPDGAGFLCVIESTSPVPSFDLQRASASMIAIHRPRLTYIGCVIEGDSYRSTVVRSVLTGMRAVITGRIAFGFFATVAEAAAPMAEALPPVTAASLERAVESARSLLVECPRPSKPPRD